MGLDSSYVPVPDIQMHVLDRLGSKISGHGVGSGDFWIQVQGGELLEIVDFLRSDPQLEFNHLVDLCGVDYLPRSPRFEVVIHLYSFSKKHRIRIRGLVPDSSLTIPSLTSRWDGANWQERETFDNYGIRFEGHPNLTRILNAPNMKAFPQRKDFPLKGDREVEEDL